MNDALYSLSGGLPRRLPGRIRLPDGSTRTDAATYSPAEIAAAGYVEAPARPAYDPTTHAPPVWTGEAWHTRGLTEAELAAIARQTTRAALRAQWDALPAWIRGPYRAAFEAANVLLDERDDTAAAELIAYQTLRSGFDETQTATFAAVQAAFAQGIADLVQ